MSIKLFTLMLTYFFSKCVLIIAMNAISVFCAYERESCRLWSVSVACVHVAEGCLL